MQERLKKLLSVKSLVTVVLTVVFCALALRGDISGQEYLTIFTTVIAFYFGTQSAKTDPTTLIKSTESTLIGKDGTADVTAE